MKAGWARFIDRFFITLLRRRVDLGAPPVLSDAGLGSAIETIRRLEKAAARFKPSKFLDARRLLMPRPLRFDEIVLRYEEEPFKLCIEMGPTQPLVVHVYPARGRLRGGLVLLHGWGQARLGAIGSFGRYVAARGIAAACLELPEHLSRRLPGRGAGEGFVSLDAKRLLPALYYSIFEAEWVRGGMAQALGVPVGVLGASLGGWVASLHMCLFEPDFVCLVSPACNPQVNFMETELFAGPKKRLKEQEIEVLGKMLLALSPVEREPLIPDRLVSIVTGRYDLLTPLDGVNAFAANAGTRPLVVVPHGHFSILFFYPELFETTFAEVEQLLMEAQG